MISYYYCEICGNMLETIHNSGNTPICCWRHMKKLKSASTDGSYEKHIPTYSTEKNLLTVDIGERPHPMELSHYIEWIAICTNQGYQRIDLNPGLYPKVTFTLHDDETPTRIFALCNLHGLWAAKFDPFTTRITEYPKAPDTLQAHPAR